MNTPQSAPPRLDKESPQVASESTRPSYWLRDPQGALIGPFTKSDACTYVQQHTHVTFEACRDGEDQWQAADVRLGHDNTQTWRAMAIAISAVVAVIVCAVAWATYQDFKKEARDGEARVARAKADIAKDHERRAMERMTEAERTQYLLKRQTEATEELVRLQKEANK